MVQIFLSILSGLMLTLSFPNPGLDFLAWFALIPLILIASQQQSLIRLFLLGLLSGLFHYLTMLYWMVQSLCYLVHLPLAYSMTIYGLLSIYLSCYPAIFLICCNRFCRHYIIAVFCLPAFWVALEYIRTYLISGFPWGLIGYSQYRNTLLIQIADILGVYGVSYLIVLGNVSISILMLSLVKKKWKNNRVSLTMAFRALAVLICFCTLSVAYGQYCIYSWDKVIQSSPTASFGIIQGNIDQSIKWDPQHTRSSEKKYLNLSITQKKNHPDLYIWPETALTFYFQKKSGQERKIKRFIKLVQSDFLIGSPAFERDDSDQYSFFNRAYLIGKDGIIKDYYDKYHLVPFGEYIPFQNVLFFMNKFVEGETNFSSGKKLHPIQWGKNRIAVQICYEIIFPDICRRIVNENATIIVNITNDAWFGRTSAPYQHFSMTVFRAIENRRALVRSANTGISGAIDPVGRVLISTPIFEEKAFTIDTPLIAHKSLYTRLGNFFGNICMFSIYIAVFIRLRQFLQRRST